MATQRQPISHLTSNQIDPIDHLREFLRKHYRLDFIIIETWSSPVVLGI